MEMWENSRCSILFHFEVPGGRWQTVIVRPVRAARVLTVSLSDYGRDVLVEDVAAP